MKELSKPIKLMGKILRIERIGEYNIKFFQRQIRIFLIIFVDFKIINTSVVLNLWSQAAPSLIHAPALIYAFIKGGRDLKTVSLL